MERHGTVADPNVEPENPLDAQMIAHGSNRRWPCVTPARSLCVLFVAEGFLWLSEGYHWFAFNQHKGWAVLITVAAVGVFLLLMSLWFLLALVFRWRFQFSILALLVLVVAVALPFSWLARDMKAAGEQREVVSDILEYRGIVVYDYQAGRFDTKSEPRVPRWLRGLLGDDPFRDVTAVIDDENVTDHIALPRLVRGRLIWTSRGGDFLLERVGGLSQLRELVLVSAPATDAGLQHLRGLTSLKRLDLSCSPITDAGLESLRGMGGLRRLNLSQTHVTDEGVRRLQHALPNCEITH
jgi:hypothetical protein